MSDTLSFNDCVWKEGSKPNGQINWESDINKLKQYIELNYKKYTSMKNMCDSHDVLSGVVKRAIDMSNVALEKDDYAWRNHRFSKNGELDYMNGLVGVKFNKWEIIKYIGRERKKNKTYKIFKCRCLNCNETISEIRYSDIIRNKTYQCRSCHISKNNRDTKRKNNRYETCGEIVKVFYDENICIIDKKYSKEVLKNYWCINNSGYFTGRIRDKDLNTELHRYIMYLSGELSLEDELVVDHINHNKLDNRYKNLRITTKSKNCSYRDYKSHNGLIGVNQKDGFWISSLRSGKFKMKKNFINKNKAIKQRLEWERDILKEFAPQKHLFKKYGVDIQ